MRNRMICLLAIAIFLAVSVNVFARPEYRSRLEVLVRGTSDEQLVRENKCNACHFGNTKKNRNDFGKAVNKNIDAATYEQLKSDRAKLSAAVDAALKAALKDKPIGGSR